MRRDQFAKLCELYQSDARKVILDKYQGDHALADDAVQAAALYVLENIGRFKQLTKSYFIQLAVNRARNARRGETRQQMRVVSVGGPADLLQVEYVAEGTRRGRVLPHPGADAQAESSTGTGRPS